jgi:hypothetical protein
VRLRRDRAQIAQNARRTLAKPGLASMFVAW